ncbi:MAG: hypothetical protein R3E78_10835 [Burkholderiaceae bacterium]
MVDDFADSIYIFGNLALPFIDMSAAEVLHRPPGDRRQRVLRVPVTIPGHTDPAAVSSVVEAIEKALAVLAHTRQGDVIADADRLAEIATGLIEPSGELLEDRVHRMHTLRQVFAEGDWLGAEQLNALQATPPKNKSQPASDWKRRGRIFGVSHGGREFFARYQFDAMYEPLPVIREVLDAFGEVADPWQLAAWFHYPNAWIAGADGVPIAPKEALDRRDDLVRAARRRHDSYVA